MMLSFFTKMSFTIQKLDLLFHMDKHGGRYWFVVIAFYIFLNLPALMAIRTTQLLVGFAGNDHPHCKTVNASCTIYGHLYLWQYYPCKQFIYHKKEFSGSLYINDLPETSTGDEYFTESDHSNKSRWCYRINLNICF